MCQFKFKLVLCLCGVFCNGVFLSKLIFNPQICIFYTGVSYVLARPLLEIVIDGQTISLQVQDSQAPPSTTVFSSSEVPEDSVDLKKGQVALDRSSWS